MIFALLLAACSDQAAPVPPEPQLQKQPSAASPPAAAASDTGSGEATAEARDAAEVLRRYYALIGERRYPDAHKLREPGDGDADAFAAYFERFATHGATVGTASAPVEAGGWHYVEVPVHTYGTTKDGVPFGSAGIVTLRRRVPGGEWRIFTKG